MQIATAPSSAIPTPTPTATPSPSPTLTPTPTPSPTPTPDLGDTDSGADAHPDTGVLRAHASFTVNPVNGTHYRNKNFPGTTFSFTTHRRTRIARLQHIWSWNFGDGQGVSSAPNPTYVFSSSNNNPGFLVQLVVSNSAGSSTATFHVVVN